MKRWPRVSLPLLMPSTSNGTTLPSSRQRMEWSGLTQRSLPEPQRIDFGQGKFATISGTISATTSAAGMPRFSITATSEAPFLSSRRSASAIEARPADLTKPLMAASGASTRGPFFSSRTEGERAGRPVTTATRRRGVAKALRSLYSRPAPASACPSKRARSSRARVCMRDGISSEKSSSRSSAIGAASLGLEPCGASRLGEVANAQDIGLPLSHRDHAARIEQIEDMRGLDRLVVSGKREEMARALIAAREQRFALGLGVAEVLEQELRVGLLEIVAGVFLLGLEKDVAIRDLVLALAAVEIEIEHVVDVLHIHGEALEPIGQLARDGIAVEAADLLEIGELGYLHAVEPDFPAEPPGAERRALPIVLDEADVVLQGIDAERDKAVEIDILDVGRRRLQDNLELVVMLEPVRILAIATILGTAGGLHVSRAPGPWPKRAKRGRRVKSPRPHFQVVRLEDHAALVGPKALEPEDEVLEGGRPRLCGFLFLGHRFSDRSVA